MNVYKYYATPEILVIASTLERAMDFFYNESGFALERDQPPSSESWEEMPSDQNLSLEWGLEGYDPEFQALESKRDPFGIFQDEKEEEEGEGFKAVSKTMGEWATLLGKGLLATEIGEGSFGIGVFERCLWSKGREIPKAA